MQCNARRRFYGTGPAFFGSFSRFTIDVVDCRSGWGGPIPNEPYLAFCARKKTKRLDYRERVLQVVGSAVDLVGRWHDIAEMLGENVCPELLQLDRVGYTFTTCF